MTEQIKSFQDLQNEACTIYASGDSFYIGRSSEIKMNVNISQLEEILQICKDKLIQAAT